jgi:hypothetical protein
MDRPKLQLQKFDIAKLKPHSTIVIIGKRNTGKSVLVTDILHAFKHMPAIVVMSGTEAGNKHFQNYVPDSFIYNDFSPEGVEALIKRQRSIIDRGASKDAASILFIMDDCSYDKKVLNRDKNLRYVFMNGRHLGITTILTTQYAMDICSGLRYNVDYVFAFRDNTVTNKDRLHRNFFGVFHRPRDFYSVYDQTTVGYDCLVLDNTSRSNKVEDQLFWFRATVRPPGSFLFGPRSLWNKHSAMYRAQGRDDTVDDTEDCAQGTVKVNKRDHVRSTVF